MKAKENKKFAIVVCGMVFMVAIFSMASISRADVMFVVNKSVTLDTLNKTDIKKIFLGDSLVWPNGEEIKIVTREKSDIQKEFTKTYTQKSESQFSNYWRRLMFSGKGTIPKSFSSDKEIINFVTNTKGAIGYITPQSLTKSVKPITISE